MAQVKSGVMVAVTLAIAALLFGVLVPIGMNAMTGETTDTITQDTGETVELHPDGLNATLDSTNAGANATYTIQYDGDSTTTTVDVNTNTTVTVGGEDVTIAPTEVNSGNATTEYTYPTTLGWGSGTTMWNTIPVFIAIALLIFLIGVGMRYMP